MGTPAERGWLVQQEERSGLCKPPSRAAFSPNKENDSRNTTRENRERGTYRGSQNDSWRLGLCSSATADGLTPLGPLAVALVVRRFMRLALRDRKCGAWQEEPAARLNAMGR